MEIAHSNNHYYTEFQSFTPSHTITGEETFVDKLTDSFIEECSFYYYFQLLLQVTWITRGNIFDTIKMKTDG